MYKCQRKCISTIKSLEHALIVVVGFDIILKEMVGMAMKIIEIEMIFNGNNNYNGNNENREQQHVYNIYSRSEISIDSRIPVISRDGFDGFKRDGREKYNECTRTIILKI
ncbi:hypothetical protein Glove_139g30 [Diversispora epigaea]|uniref:Uncharacterized protein n=1 Tax=Diversispora epigaea TaxID=1348612 RepID=A0A397IVP3_9GLOM|nr:hypothetical protein Glove_139g30 [Diversispora epigaea]